MDHSFNRKNIYITKYLSPINQSIIIICLLYQKYDGQEIDGWMDRIAQELKRKTCRKKRTKEGKV